MSRKGAPKPRATSAYATQFYFTFTSSPPNTPVTPTLIHPHLPSQAQRQPHLSFLHHLYLATPVKLTHTPVIQTTSLKPTIPSTTVNQHSPTPVTSTQHHPHTCRPQHCTPHTWFPPSLSLRTLTCINHTFQSLQFNVVSDLNNLNILNQGTYSTYQAPITAVFQDDRDLSSFFFKYDFPIQDAGVW